MLKSFFSTILAMFCFLLLETAVFSNLTYLPAIPDFLLIITLFVALNNGSLLAESTGFASGFLLDFLSASPLGFNALLRTILGFVFGLFHDVLNASSIFLQFVYGAIATIIKSENKDKNLKIIGVNKAFNKTSVKKIWENNE